MFTQSKHRAAAAAFAFATALALAACSTTSEQAASEPASGAGTVTGSAGSSAVTGGTAGDVLTTPASPAPARYDRYGYYDRNGSYIPYDNSRGAYCARWSPETGSCVWWATG